jgi:hypothetical protein
MVPPASMFVLILIFVSPFRFHSPATSSLDGIHKCSRSATSQLAIHRAKMLIYLEPNAVGRLSAISLVLGNYQFDVPSFSAGLHRDMLDRIQAEGPRLGRPLARKIRPDYLPGDQQGLERFRREVRLASALNHRISARFATLLNIKASRCP